MVAVLLAILAWLVAAAWLVAWFDPSFKLNQLFGGAAEYARSTYLAVATVGSLAVVGLAATAFQVYNWYFYGDSFILMNWSFCCGQCCDSYSRMSWWDWYWCTRVMEDCCALGRRSASSIRKEDFHVAAVVAGCAFGGGCRSL